MALVGFLLGALKYPRVDGFSAADPAQLQAAVVWLENTKVWAGPEWEGSFPVRAHLAALERCLLRPGAAAGARPCVRRPPTMPRVSPPAPWPTPWPTPAARAQVRRYPIDGRGALQSPEPATFRAALARYLADLECPLQLAPGGEPALLQWLLQHAGAWRVGAACVLAGRRALRL